MKIVSYDSGKQKQISPSAINASVILKNIEKIICGVEMILRVYIPDERLQEMKASESLVEVLLGKEYSFKDKSGQIIKLDRIIIFRSGEMSPDKENSTVTILTGNGAYDGSPYRCKGVYKNYLNIINILKKIKLL